MLAGPVWVSAGASGRPMYVYHCRTYKKAVSGGGHVLKDTTAAACAFESGQLTLVSGAGEGEVVSEVGEEERGAQEGVDRRSDNATSVDVFVEIDPHRSLGQILKIGLLCSVCP